MLPSLQLKLLGGIVPEIYIFPIKKVTYCPYLNSDFKSTISESFGLGFHQQFAVLAAHLFGRAGASIYTFKHWH